MREATRRDLSANRIQVAISNLQQKGEVMHALAQKATKNYHRLMAQVSAARTTASAPYQNELRAAENRRTQARQVENAIRAAREAAVDGTERVGNAKAALAESVAAEHKAAAGLKEATLAVHQAQMKAKLSAQQLHNSRVSKRLAETRLQDDEKRHDSTSQRLQNLERARHRAVSVAVPRSATESKTNYQDIVSDLARAAESAKRESEEWRKELMEINQKIRALNAEKR